MNDDKLDRLVLLSRGSAGKLTDVMRVFPFDPDGQYELRVWEAPQELPKIDFENPTDVGMAEMPIINGNNTKITTRFDEEGD